MEQTEENVVQNVAFLLVCLSNCRCHVCCNKERNLDVSAPPNEKKCIRETTAEGSSRKRKLPSDEMKEKPWKKMKVGSHVCPICRKSFPTGPQLGGHMRAHYKKKQQNQRAG